jgi:hypothetical protein
MLKVVLIAFLAAFAAALLPVVTGCGDEECLVLGERCNDEYLQETYGNTNIDCCGDTVCNGDVCMPDEEPP